MICIIDYGMGNLRSVQKGFEKVGFKAVITASKSQLNKAAGIVLPGVGAFSQAIYNLKQAGLDKLIKEQIEAGKPFLGICLGLQLLFSESEEGGVFAGLDIIKGKVTRLPAFVKVPHIGWNQVKIVKKDSYTVALPEQEYYYFVHSYKVEPQDTTVIAGTTNYGGEFVSLITKKNIVACQFHPEKSSYFGLQLLKSFGEVCRDYFSRS